MKQVIFTILFISLFSVLIQGQTKPTKKPISKPTPQKVQEVTTQKAVTENGKPVVLKSNGTWEFAPAVEVSEKPQIKPCDLTLKDAPVIRGFKLGMTNDEVEAFLREQKISEGSVYGVNFTSLPNAIRLETYDYALKSYLGFRGIDKLELGFFGNQLH